MARYCPLFSGSEGNCTYIGNTDAGILIDAGVSAKRMEAALSDRGITPDRIAAIFVTHEHSDHISGLKTWTKKYRVPIYATEGTLSALSGADRLAVGTVCRAITPDNDRGVEAGDCFVTAFSTPHDSRQSCGYIVHTADGQRVAIATDIGHVSDTVRRAITGCELIQIESNHDVEMLRAGPYPYPLKQRILSANGHLDNTACAAQLYELAQSGTARFVLAHLSRQNNRPDLALETANAALATHGLIAGIDYILRVAAPCDTDGIMRF